MSQIADLLVRAAAMRRGRLTPQQEARRKAVDARNEAIQAVGPRPVDGITFGTGKPPKVRELASQSSAPDGRQQP